MHLHLDTVGGISGNMFVGALLDCWPEFTEQLQKQIELAGFADLVSLSFERKNDGVLHGTYFDVEEKIKINNNKNNNIKDNLNQDSRHNHHSHKHSHRHYSEIKQTLSDSQLEENVKIHALGIFHCLAEAEAEVHGKEIATVAFHEVGAWDSIADIVSAAFLIEACGARSWSVSSLPLGNGQVKTAHGMLPIPAPAVTLLLKGFQFHDDGLTGERVTPTGAAILKYLQAKTSKPKQVLSLEKSGFGFGSYQFEGISNVLRVLAFSRTSGNEGIESEQTWQEQTIIELAFEVDDQSPEDLAAGLENIRQCEGVLDILQYSVKGKKQRTAASIRILLEEDAEQQIMTACFNETTTLGIRKEKISRGAIPRMEVMVVHDEKSYRVKISQRPNGELSAKAEFDDYGYGELSQNERALLKKEVEALAFDLLVSEQEKDKKNA